MPILKITCSPAKHFKALKNGAIRYQKSPVAIPLWRFAVLTDDGALFGRLFLEKPTLDGLWGCMNHVLDQVQDAADRQILMASSLDNAFPAFAPMLQERGFEVYVPNGSSGGLATVARRWDGFLTTLDFRMGSLSEADLTVDESIALAGNGAGVIGPISQGKDFEAASAIAKQVCVLRGRDPNEGARRWQTTGIRTKPHTSTSTAADPDGLASLIEEYSPGNVPVGYVLTPEGRRIYDIARGLQGVCRSPANSDEAMVARVRLAQVVQQSFLARATEESADASLADASRYLTPVSMVLLRWLGFDSQEMRAFQEGLVDACRYPAVIDGVTHVFFRLPVQWQFTGGLEQKRKVRYLPWREVVEQHLMMSLPPGCRVVLNDDIRDSQREGEREFSLCCALLHIMRFGRRFGEEKGKRTSVAIPKGQDEMGGGASLVGLIRSPVVGGAPPAWRPNIEQVVADAAATINANLANSLSGLTFSLRPPVPM